jgi:putative transposase
MPRTARVVIPDVPHHITHRGNHGEDVFFSDGDRLLYLDLMRDFSREHGLEIHSYALMTNHVHLVATPRTLTSIATTLKRVHLKLTQHVNKRRGRTGVTWQGRPYSCPLDETHFWFAVRYVERNPVRAGMVVRAEDYPWSSAAAHCGRRRDALLTGELEKSGFCEDWSAWLAQVDEEEKAKTLRRCTRSGFPFGCEEFVARIEKLCGRILRPRHPGPTKR